MSKHTPGPWEVITSRDVWSSVVAPCVALICSDVENDGDAQLIAAAPDLLAACVALQMEAAARGCGLRIADEAIRKATGEPE